MNGSDRRLYKFSGPTEYALQNLERGVIFCQHYSAYNDPFEFWSNVLEGVPDPDTEPERFVAATKAWGFEPGSADDENLVEYFDQCSEEQPSFGEWRESTRIACFGSEPDNLLMWSHYADGLRGFCLVFDDTEILEASPRSSFAIDVAYLDAPRNADAFVCAICNDQIDYHEMAIGEAEGQAKYQGKIDPFLEDYRKTLDSSILGWQEIMQMVFATKPTDWSYEAERRLLVQASTDSHDPLFHPYPNTALREVLIGERMSGAFRDRLELIISKSYPDVSVRIVKRSPSKFRLEIK
jgi:hypothetical protein